MAYATNKSFSFYQIDVKSSFLNYDHKEEVYIEHHDGFPLIEKDDMVCRLKKALYRLKQAPRARYARLAKYLKKLRIVKVMLTVTCI